MAFPVDPDVEHEYVPSPEDETVGNPELPVAPEDLLDADPTVGEPDAPNSAATPVEDEGPGVPSNMQDPDWSPDNEQPAEPAYMGVYGVPLEGAGIVSDDDAGDVYGASTLSPSDLEWEGVEGVEPVTPPVDGLDDWEYLASEDFDTEEWGVGVADDATDMPVSYEIQGKEPGGSFRTLATVSATELTTEIRGLPTGEGWVFRVRAVFLSGETGEWSSETSVNLPEDMIAPPTPAPFGVSAGRGIVTLVFSGMGSNGESQPADYKHTVMLVSETGDPSTWIPLGVIVGAGEFMWTGADYNKPYYFSGYSVDLAGNQSSMSVPVMATLSPLVEEPDIRAAIDAIDVDGWVTEAGLLNDRLADAEAELDAHSTRLTGAEGDLDVLVTDVLPELEGDLGTLRDVTVPGISQRLGDAESELSTTKTQLGNRLTSAESSLADHSARISDAEGELDAAFGQIAAAQNAADGAATAASSAQDAADSAMSYAQDQVAQLVARGQNLVRNGDFEAGTDGWTTQAYAHISDTESRSGSRSCKIGPSSGSMWPCSEFVPSSQGRSYYAEYWVKRTGSESIPNAVGFVFQILRTDGTTGQLIPSLRANSTDVSDSEWTKISTTYTLSDPDIVKIRFAPWFIATTNAYYVDDFLAIDVTEAKEALTAAAAAQSRADDAHTLAGTAKSTADGALTMAGTKSSVYYSTSAPSGTASEGDLWRRRKSANEHEVIGEWQWTGGGWRSQTVSGSIVSNFDIGFLTAGSATISQAVIDKLVAATANFQTADIKNLFVSSGTFSEAVIDKLWADVVNARKITASMITVGGGNLVPSPRFEDPGEWTLIAGSASRVPFIQPDSFTVRDGNGRRLAIQNDPANSSSNPSGIYSAQFPVDEGAPYLVSGWAMTGFIHNSVARLYVRFYKTDGTYTSSYVGLGAGAASEWNRVSGTVTVPAGYTMMRVGGMSSGTGIWVYWDDFRVTRMTDGALTVAGSIAAEHLDVDSVSAAVANVIKLNASAINAGTINTARLNTAEIAAATASIQKADIKNLTVSNGTFSEAVIEKLWADVIHARKITADMLVIHSSDNLIADSGFMDPELNSARIAASNGVLDMHLVSGVDSQRYARIPASTSIARLRLVASAAQYGVPVVAGATYRVRYQASSGGGSCRTRALVTFIDVNGSATNTFPTGDGAVTTSSSWRWCDYEIVAPNNAVSAYVYIQRLAGDDGVLYAKRPMMTRMAGGELIVDGAITAGKLAAKSVVAGKLAADAVDADSIAAGAIDGKLITGATVRTNATSSRIEMSGNRLRMLNAGSNVFDLDAATGLMYAEGTILVRGTSGATGYQTQLGTNGGMPALMGLASGHSRGYYLEPTLNGARFSSMVRTVTGGQMQASYGMHMNAQSSATNGFTNGEIALWFNDAWGNLGTGPTGGGNQWYGVSMFRQSRYSGVPGVRVYHNYGDLAPTTTSGTNVVVREDMGERVLLFMSSLSKHKLAQRVQDDSVEDRILSVEPKTWFDREQAESLSEAYRPRTAHEAIDELTPLRPGEHEAPPEPVLRRIPGVIAEDVRDAGLDEFLTYGLDGEMTGVMYDRFGVALIPVVRKQREKIAEQEERIASLEDKLAALMERVDALESA